MPTKWIILEAFLGADGKVLEWEPAGTIEGEEGEVEREARRMWGTLRGTPLKALPWDTASPEERADAENGDRERAMFDLAPPIVGEAILAISELARRGGASPEESDRVVLSYRITPSDVRWRGGLREDEGGQLSVIYAVQSDLLTPEQQQRIGAVTAAAYVGFFDAAAEGFPLSDVERIEERFGAPLSQAYAGAGRSFLKFCRTYWTLMVLMHALTDRGLNHYLITQLLRQLDAVLSELFFPSPGPLMIDPAKREADQRRFVRAFAPHVDVDEFITGNTVLAEQRERWKRQ